MQSESGPADLHDHGDVSSVSSSTGVPTMPGDNISPCVTPGSAAKNTSHEAKTADAAHPTSWLVWRQPSDGAHEVVVSAARSSSHLSVHERTGDSRQDPASHAGAPPCPITAPHGILDHVQNATFRRRNRVSSSSVTPPRSRCEAMWLI